MTLRIISENIYFFNVATIIIFLSAKVQKKEEIIVFSHTILGIYNMSKALETLKEYWGYSAFRPMQLEIIEQVIMGNDLLAMLPTGGGKSLTFQVPALMLNGVCLVITPLIALMKDQVENLNKLGISADAIFSGMDNAKIMSVLNKAAAGKSKLLYISPERLSSERFQSYLSLLPISMIAVDEAHCISQWGYDFRPSYLQIASIKERFPYAPILALTATATPQVAKDIQDRLGFDDYNVLMGSFRRENLSYVVRKVGDRAGEVVRILQRVGGCAIVYVRRRSSTFELAEYLNKKGISALPYNAGLSMESRTVNQERWMKGEVKVMVATNAFGMGIDKPDVRVVIHHDIPDSLEAYFQEAGRAGRDGLRSYAVLLMGETSLKNLSTRVSKQYPSKEKIRELYDMICDYCGLAEGYGDDSVYPFDMERFCTNFKQNIECVTASINLLQNAGYMELSDSARGSSRVQLLANIQDIRHYDFEPKIERVVEYILRHFQGVFTHFVYFDEQEMSNDIGMERSDLYDSFIHLSRIGVLSYVPGDNRLAMRFNEPRLPSNYINFPQSIYEDRIKVFKERIDAMSKYLQLSDMCRQQYLMEYFGSKEKCECGVCDLCLAKKKMAASTNELRSDMLSLLSNGEYNLHDLQSTLDCDSETFFKVLRTLLDEGNVVYSSTMTVKLAKP